MKTKQQIDDIEKVWEKFHKDRSDESRNLLLEHYRYIVKYAADRLHSKLPAEVEVDDLMSAGTFGLMAAINAYDPGRGVKFETYCSPRIKGSILDELRSMDWVPRLVRSRANQLIKATRALEINLGRKPTEKETAKELKLNMVEFDRFQRDANAVSLISLNTNFNEGNNEKDIHEIDTIKDRKSKNPLIEAQKRDLKNFLIEGLTDVERHFIILYYYEEMTMKEISAALGLSQSYISKKHSSIITRLKIRSMQRIGK